MKIKLIPLIFMTYFLFNGCAAIVTSPVGGGTGG